MSDATDRRTFLKTGLTAAGGLVAASGLSGTNAQAQDGSVRFGIIADPHHGLAPDAAERLAAFVDAVERRGDLDFLIQLGDFCHPSEEAEPFMDIWRRYPGPTHHVLGNHDMDRGSKADILATWGADAPYHSFDVGAFHFVTLDLNHIREGGAMVDYAGGNYFHTQGSLNWAGPEQLAWLAADLAATDMPTVVFAHQPLGFTLSDAPLPPQQVQVLDVLATANRLAGRQKVVACLTGHLHIDHAVEHKGVHCVSVNSASYHWAAGMHAYADPLFAFVTLDPAGVMTVEGRTSQFAESDASEREDRRGLPGIAATISDRRLTWPGV